MRKDLYLDIQAAIQLDLDVGDDRVADLVEQHEDLVANEVRAVEFGSVKDGYRKEWDAESVEMEIAIEKMVEATA